MEISHSSKFTSVEFVQNFLVTYYIEEVVFSFKVTQFHHIGMDACRVCAPDIFHSLSLFFEFATFKYVVRHFWCPDLVYVLFDHFLFRDSYRNEM